MAKPAENPDRVSAAIKTPQHTADEAPGPEEDDLDDLDDMLDEFSAAKLDEKTDAPSASGPGRPDSHGVNIKVDGSTDDFNKELHEQMAALMGEIDESTEMREQFESMMKDLTTAADPGISAQTNEAAITPGPSGAAASAAAPEESFQETIRKTMERMQASGEQATAAAVSDDSDDILAQMLKDMQGGGPDSTGGEEDFSKLLMGMMEQLTNKDILYEPMKELHDKFPAWMSKNEEKTKADDLQRYKEQQGLVKEIVARFESKGYSDDHVADREFIIEKMQKMQAAGSPPADLVGDMNAAQEALGDLDSGCSQQ